jgi:SAM-dependent methyltransferase
MLKRAVSNWTNWYRKLGLWRLGWGAGQDYKDYLKLQYERSVSLQNNNPAERIRILVDDLVRYGKPNINSNLLCVGVRNSVEIEVLRAQGFSRIIGIDLFSVSPEIQVMDMHRLKFRDDTFDVIFCSHAMEHSSDPKLVAREMIRVARFDAIIAIEVPNNFGIRGADLVDFKNLENLYGMFGDHVHRKLFSEEIPPLATNNPMKVSVLRAIFTVKK